MEYGARHERSAIASPRSGIPLRTRSASGMLMNGPEGPSFYCYDEATHNPTCQDDGCPAPHDVCEGVHCFGICPREDGRAGHPRELGRAVATRRRRPRGRRPATWRCRQES